MYGHHGSKAAGNMIGHLLGYDLKERGVPIAMIHVRLKSIPRPSNHYPRSSHSCHSLLPLTAPSPNTHIIDTDHSLDS